MRDASRQAGHTEVAGRTFRDSGDLHVLARPKHVVDDMDHGRARRHILADDRRNGAVPRRSQTDDVWGIGVDLNRDCGPRKRLEMTAMRQVLAGQAALNSVEPQEGGQPLRVGHEPRDRVGARKRLHVFPRRVSWHKHGNLGTLRRELSSYAGILGEHTEHGQGGLLLAQVVCRPALAFRSTRCTAPRR